MKKKTNLKHCPWLQGYYKYGDKAFNNKWESFIHSTNIDWVPTKQIEYERIFCTVFFMPFYMSETIYDDFKAVIKLLSMSVGW